MLKKLKVVTIGGGSSYTPEFCEGLIKRYQSFPITEWILVDTYEDKGKEKNEIIVALVKRMFLKAKLQVQVTSAYDLNEAVLKDANFVTTQLRVGFLEARKKDEQIALKNGMLGQETNGIGGQFKAMRTIPVIQKIVQKVKKYAPQAWIINFANPSGMVTEAIHRYENFSRFIGVCNVPIHTRISTAEVLNIDYHDLQVDAGGLNHMIFFTKFYHHNQDITSKTLEQLIHSTSNEQISLKNISDLPWNPSFIKALKAFPCGYHKYYYKRGTMLKKALAAYAENGTRAEQVLALEKTLFQKYQDPQLDIKPPELQERGGAYYSDVACGVMNAIYNDTNEEFVVNTINNGKISNLPHDWIIECTCQINAQGAQAVNRKITIPPAVLPLIKTIKEFEFLTIEAIAQKSRSLALLAAITNPLSEDDFQTEKAFDQLMEAHQKYLPKYQ